MSYKFKESILPSDFRKEDIGTIKKLINRSTSFTIVGMPGMGISAFLKYLVCQKFAYFIHIDLYELPELTRLQLFKLTAKELEIKTSSNDAIELLDDIKGKLKDLIKEHKRVVLVLNRFDQIKDEFTTTFFSNLRTILEVDKEKIVFAFSANKPLYDWAPNAFERSNLELYSQNYFLKPYNKDELIQLCKLYMPNVEVDSEFLGLSGGHFQLLQLIIKSGKKTNFLSDVFVRLQLKRIYEESLNGKQRQQVQKIANNKSVKKIDEYLLRMGAAIKDGNEHKLFSPLFSQYLRETSTPRYTRLEARLMKLLKDNLGKIVAKDTIFEALWPNDVDGQSDWALNALIYRLRNNPAFVGKGYTIISLKKQGYSLHRD